MIHEYNELVKPKGTLILGSIGYKGIEKKFVRLHKLRDAGERSKFLDIVHVNDFCHTNQFYIGDALRVDVTVFTLKEMDRIVLVSSVASNSLVPMVSLIPNRDRLSSMRQMLETAIRAIGESTECEIPVWRRKPLVGIKNSEMRQQRFMGILNSLVIVSFLAKSECLEDQEKAMKTLVSDVVVPNGSLLRQGRFGGTMFVATAQDGNEQVYPIAFGYGDSKNNLSWEWFLDCLKGALGHIDDLVFIFDRHASIEAAISKVFPYATHTICCWYFAENVKKRFHRKDVTAIMDKAARAYTEFKYNWYMVSYVRMLSIMLKLPVHTNGPVYTVPNEEFIRNMLQHWFHDRHRAAQSMRHQLTDTAYLVMLKRVEKCGYMTVNPVDWNIFSVKRSGKQWTIFQMDRQSEKHMEQNSNLTYLCANYYKRKTLFDAYSVPIIPVGHPSSWVVPSDIAERVVLNPKTKRQSGRLMEGRHTSSSKRTTTQSCRSYGQAGHNSRRCSNPLLINEGPSRIVLEEYHRKCSICHKIRHNK
ncbi:hypothetical protein Dsin_001418 [Dipteronia sinensis]|uniref:MULE transposase domain-containing protein n=1 Tax=Dipteronia sinensis TaxID=43782 RepID=A0AAE0EIZ4_9ROSI|nr:hypothetical protein Dsin_001418 [Dipteronia sinensis]